MAFSFIQLFLYLPTHSFHTPHSQTLYFPTNFLCYFSILLSFLHILIHPSTIYLFIDSHIHFLFIFIQNIKANTVYLHTYNESVKNYIQFSFVIVCKTESCKDELYKRSRQRWCDELDICPHPSSGDTFLSICQLLQLDRGNNHQLEHHLWNDSNFEGLSMPISTN